MEARRCSPRRRGYREAAASWAAVLRDLGARGLGVPKLLVADGHMGIWAAARQVWPEAAEQRCWKAAGRFRGIAARRPDRRRGRLQKTAGEDGAARSKRSVSHTPAAGGPRWRMARAAPLLPKAPGKPEAAANPGLRLPRRPGCAALPFPRPLSGLLPRPGRSAIVFPLEDFTGRGNTDDDYTPPSASSMFLSLDDCESVGG